MPEYVNASPAKRFFVEMLIRDIRLEDAILDLVDNAIDSLIRTERIDLPKLLTSLTNSSSTNEEIHVDRVVEIDISDEEFLIEDNCGGIEIEHAKEHVFRFGTVRKPEDAHLSVYGIGLKRAVFKIGRSIVVESRTLSSGFRVKIDVDQFEKSNDKWQFPIEEMKPAATLRDCGTKITIRKLTEESRSRLKGATFENDLVQTIGQSYSLFLGKFVKVIYNGQAVDPVVIPISDSQDVVTSLTKDEFGEVQVFVIAGLQTLDGKDWRGQTAGWYIICNGRVVVFADRTALTGWGVRLPIFQPKHRGFIGIAMFVSGDPEALPWTTTKRGVNAESAVFQYVKERMMADARPVIRFLDRRYESVPVSSENSDNLQVRDSLLQEALVPTQINKILGEDQRRFTASRSVKRRANMLSVQYRTERSNIERAREAIGDQSLAAGKVGLHALEYFLSNEAKK